MQKLRKNLPAVTSCILLTIISFLYFFTITTYGTVSERQIANVLMGVIFILVLSFVNEEHLYKAALPIYLCVTAILTVQLFIDNYPLVYNRYLSIGTVVLYTASLLPLTSIQIAKSITKYSKISVKRFIRLSALSLLPIGLVLVQANIAPSFVAIIVFAIGVVVLKRENRLNIPWRLIAIPAILLGILIVIIHSEGGYVSEKIDVVLTRGTCDPYGVGWMRTVLDAIFKNTPLMGASDFNLKDVDLIGTLFRWGDHRMVILLAQYGWIAFIASVLIYVAFFVCIFTMVFKTEQSSFAKYTSLFLSLSLLVQAAHSLISLLLLDCGHLNMPYMGGLTMNLINYISFAIILTLYLKREEPSKIKEIEIDKEEIHCSIFKRIFKYDDFNDKEIDEDFDDTDFVDFEEFIKNEAEKRSQYKSYFTKLRDELRASIDENEEETED